MDALCADRFAQYLFRCCRLGCYRFACNSNVYVNSTLALSATVAPSNADNHAVTWSSSNPGVATVDINGVVTGVSPGSATITATTAGLSVVAGSSTIRVVSLATPVTGVGLWPAAFSLNAGSSAQLQATFSPSAASNQQLFWTSSDPGVATVNSNGVVTAKSSNCGTVDSTGVITASAPSPLRLQRLRPMAATRLPAR